MESETGSNSKPGVTPPATRPGDDLIGLILLEKYLITARLAEGGSGIVYKGMDTLLDRPVAVKVLHDHLISNSKAKERFIQESLALVSVTHPGIVTVFARGELENGRLFLVMDYVEGKTLAEILVEKKRLLRDQAYGMFEQLLDALQAAHEAGLVHRDIKPANIVLSEDGESSQAMLLDFGIAKFVVAEQNLAQTGTGNFAGSSAYMSPEQCSAAPVDRRSDLYSLGLVIYECLAGTPLFSGETDMETMYKQIHKSVKDSGKLTRVPGEFRLFLQRSLEKDPSLRFDNAQGMKKALLDCRQLRKATQLRLILISVIVITACSLAGSLLYRRGIERQTQQELKKLASEQLSHSSDSNRTPLLPHIQSSRELYNFLRPENKEFSEEEKISLAYSWMEQDPKRGGKISEQKFAPGVKILAEHLENHGRPEEAIKLFERALMYHEWGPRDLFELHRRLGTSYKNAKMKGPALKELNTAFELSKNLGNDIALEINQTLTSFYKDAGETAKSEQYCRTAWGLCQDLDADQLSSAGISYSDTLKTLNKKQLSEQIALKALKVLESASQRFEDIDKRKATLIDYAGASADEPQLEFAAKFYLVNLHQSTRFANDCYDRACDIAEVYRQKRLETKWLDMWKAITEQVSPQDSFRDFLDSRRHYSRALESTWQYEKAVALLLNSMEEWRKSKSDITLGRKRYENLIESLLQPAVMLSIKTKQAESFSGEVEKNLAELPAKSNQRTAFLAALAECDLQQKKYSEAIEAIKKAREACDQDAIFISSTLDAKLAEILLKANRKEEGKHVLADMLHRLNSIVDADAELAFAYGMAAHYAEADRMWPEAAKDWALALKHSLNSNKGYANLDLYERLIGLEYERMGNYKEAEAHFSNALSALMNKDSQQVGLQALLFSDIGNTVLDRKELGLAGKSTLGVLRYKLELYFANNNSAEDIPEAELEPVKRFLSRLETEATVQQKPAIANEAHKVAELFPKHHP